MADSPRPRTLRAAYLALYTLGGCCTAVCVALLAWVAFCIAMEKEPLAADGCAGGFAAGQCGILELRGAGRFGAEFRHDTRGCNARPPLVPNHPDGAVRADSADVRGLR